MDKNLDDNHVYFELATRNDYVEKFVNVLSMNGYQNYVINHPEEFGKKIVVVDPIKKGG